MSEQQNEKAWTMFSLLTQKQQNYIVEKVRIERESQEEDWFNNLPEERQDQLVDAWFEMVRKDNLYETFIHDLFYYLAIFKIDPKHKSNTPHVFHRRMSFF